MKTAVIYARYSSDRQTEQSIEGQLRVCNEYASKNDIVIVDTYIDRAMTGTNDNRADFQRMLKDSEKKAWDYVLVYKLDRFSRNKYEMAMHKKKLKDNGVKLLSAMENIPDTPEGIILESLLEGMAEYYSAELSQKVRRGMRESREKGNFCGGNLIYGYKVENKKVVIDEEQASIIIYIFSEFASGRLIVDIMKELEERGVKNKGKPFAKSTLYRLLGNEKYAGIYRHENEVFNNIYPRIVPQNIFDIVKLKLDTNKYGKHVPEIYYLLKNKVKCGYCGKPVNSDAGTSRRGKVLRYYNCSGKRSKTTKCKQQTIRKEVLEKLILDTILETMSSDMIDYVAEQIICVHAKKMNDESMLNLLLRDYKQVEKGINNILNAIEKGIVTPSTKERLEDLENKRVEIENKIAVEKTKTKLQLVKKDVINFLLKAISKDPRQMVNMLIKEIILYNDKIEIYMNYTNKKTPDDENHKAFLFYQTTKSITIDSHKFHVEPKLFEYDIRLNI